MDATTIKDWASRKSAEGAAPKPEGEGGTEGGEEAGGDPGEVLNEVVTSLRDHSDALEGILGQATDADKIRDLQTKVKELADEVEECAKEYAEADHDDEEEEGGEEAATEGE